MPAFLAPMYLCDDCRRTFRLAGAERPGPIYCPHCGGRGYETLERFVPMVQHGERASVYSVLDTWAPGEQPAVVRSFSTADEPLAAFLARDYCTRHNAKEMSR